MNFGHYDTRRQKPLLKKSIILPQNCPWRIGAIGSGIDVAPGISGPAFGVLPKTGDEELEDRGKPG